MDLLCLFIKLAPIVVITKSLTKYPKNSTSFKTNPVPTIKDHIAQALSKLLYYSVIHALIVIHHSKSIRYLNICMNLI